jgi:hypothetical protein
VRPCTGAIQALTFSLYILKAGPYSTTSFNSFSLLSLVLPLFGADSSGPLGAGKLQRGGFFIYFFISIYVIQHCFICRPSDSTASEDAGIEPRTVATLALIARRFNQLARSHPHLARSHPHLARSHPGAGKLCTRLSSSYLLPFTYMYILSLLLGV